VPPKRLEMSMNSMSLGRIYGPPKPSKRTELASMLSLTFLQVKS